MPPKCTQRHYLSTTHEKFNKKGIIQLCCSNQTINVRNRIIEARIKLEGALYYIQTKAPNWNTKNRQNSLQHTIALLMSQEPTNETLLSRPLSISKPQVLEFVLLKIKDDTIVYSLKENTTQNNTEAELKTTLQ